MMSVRVYNQPGPSRMNLPGSSRPFGSSPGSVDSGITPKQKAVCRALFTGPDSRADNYARDKLKEICAADSLKYNFDFEREVPLPGRWKWQPMDVITSVTSSTPRTPRVIPKATIAVAPFISTEPTDDDISVDSLLMVPEDEEASSATAMDQTQEPCCSKSIPVVSTPVPCGSMDTLEESQSIPPPVAVQSSPELPQRTSPLKHEDETRKAIDTTKPKTKQQKMNNVFKETKRPNPRVQVGGGKKKKKP